MSRVQRVFVNGAEVPVRRLHVSINSDGYTVIRIEVSAAQAPNMADALGTRYAGDPAGCRFCARPIEGRHASARYCTTRCRQAHYDLRRGKSSRVPDWAA